MSDDTSRLPTHDEMVAQIERLLGCRLTEEEANRLFWDEILRRMNHPDKIAKQKAEIAEAKRNLAHYKAMDPVGYAEFESWWEDHHRQGSVPSIRRKED